MLFSYRLKKSFLNLALTAVICGTITPSLMHAQTLGREKDGITEETLTNLGDLSAGQKAFLATTLATMFYLIMKPSSNEPPRISWTEVKDLLANPKQLAADLKSDFNGTMKKFWYAIDDLVLGRIYSSSSAKTDENGRVYVKTITVHPQGILGTVISLRKYIGRGIGDALGFAMLLDGEFRNGLLKLKTPNLAAFLLALGLPRIIK